MSLSVVEMEELTNLNNRSSAALNMMAHMIGTRPWHPSQRARLMGLLDEREQHDFVEDTVLLVFMRDWVPRLEALKTELGR